MVCTDEVARPPVGDSDLRASGSRPEAACRASGRPKRAYLESGANARKLWRSIVTDVTVRQNRAMNGRSQIAKIGERGCKFRKTGILGSFGFESLAHKNRGFQQRRYVEQFTSGEYQRWYRKAFQPRLRLGMTALAAGTVAMRRMETPSSSRCVA